MFPKVLADKIYTSNEFKKVKENFTVSGFIKHTRFLYINYLELYNKYFKQNIHRSQMNCQSLAKNMETSEVKEWLQNTRVS